jgi:hypothetical protein
MSLSLGRPPNCHQIDRISAPHLMGGVRLAAAPDGGPGRVLNSRLGAFG